MPGAPDVFFPGALQQSVNYKTMFNTKHVAFMYIKATEKTIVTLSWSLKIWSANFFLRVALCQKISRTSKSFEYGSKFYVGNHRERVHKNGITLTLSRHCLTRDDS
jgi:hypothetical protein